MAFAPLSGVRVIELATVIMGPYAGQQLGDLGAEVIKVEGAGDPIRGFPPQRNPGMSGVSLTLNRNKRSIELDLKSPDGRDALSELLRGADVLLTTMRPSALARLALDPATIRSEYPELIYARAAGFRSDSERADAAAYDDLVQAASGLVWLNEQTTGKPHYLPIILADKVCGLLLAQAVLAALIERSNTGRATDIEVPMVDSMLAFNLVEHMVGAVFVPPEEPHFGYGRMMTSHRLACSTTDGTMCVLPYNDRNWRDFFTAAGHPELADDPRFTTITERIENADDLYRTLGELTRTFSTAELQEFCDRHSIPAYPVQSFDDATSGHYIRSSNGIQEMEHPTEGRYNYVAPGTRYDGDPLPLHRHAPRMGADTTDVLAEMLADDRAGKSAR